MLENSSFKSSKVLMAIDEAMTTNFSVTASGKKSDDAKMQNSAKKNEQSDRKNVSSNHKAIFEAINSRRKSGPFVTSNFPKSPAVKEANKSLISLKSPLKRAIEARRKSFTQPDEPKCSGNTPISQKNTPSRQRKDNASAFMQSMKQIESRRKSYGVSQANNIKEESREENVKNVQPSIVLSETISQSPYRQNKSSLLRQIESRRKSYGVTKSPAKQVICEIVTNTLETTTPVKLKNSSNDNVSTRKSTKKSKTPSADVKNIDEEIDFDGKITNDFKPRLSLTSDEIVAASCTQLAVDSLAVTLESQVIIIL